MCLAGWRRLVAAVAAAAVVGVLAGCAGSAGDGPFAAASQQPVSVTQPTTTPTSRPTPTTALAPTTVATTTPEPTPAAAPITIDWVGDMTFGTPTLVPAGGAAAVLRNVPTADLHSDLTLGNLETSVGDGLPLTKCAPGEANCYQFETPTATAGVLARAGFSAVNVANNHTIDAGAAGEASTDAALQSAGIAWAGRPGQTTTIERGGVKIALLGFAPYTFDDDALDLAAATAQVKAAKASADLVIVMIHLGAEGDTATHVPAGDEHYLGEDRGDSTAFTHAVIDAGADLVVGSGPHVLRGMQWYHGHLIAYSLGNFCGYETLPVTAVTSISAVLHVTLASDGTFVSGGITPMRITQPGTPAPDPSNQAVTIHRDSSLGGVR